MEPPQDVILEVMKACSCDEQEAVDLLRHTNNDARKAKSRYKTLMKYMPARSPPRDSNVHSQAISPQQPAIGVLENGSDFMPTPVSFWAEGVAEHGIAKSQMTETTVVALDERRRNFSTTSRDLSEQRISSPGPQSQALITSQSPPIPPRKPLAISPKPDRNISGSSSVGNAHKFPEPAPRRDQPPNIHTQRKAPSQEYSRSQQHSFQESPSRDQTVDSSRDSSSVVAKVAEDEFSSGLQTRPSGQPLASQPINDGRLPKARIRRSARYEKEQETPDDPKEYADWDFLLPSLPSPLSKAANEEDAHSFDLQNLVAALQHGANEQTVQTYLTGFDYQTIRQRINESVSGFPSIFYAVATNSDHIVRLWIAFGANVKAVEPHSRIPLLAFAIVHGETLDRDTSQIVATLLSLGAPPRAIPSSLYTPYIREAIDTVESGKGINDGKQETPRWLTPSARAQLTKGMHLTHRYHLERATKTTKPLDRLCQVAWRKMAEAILGLPYYFIGQSIATNALVQKYLGHLAVAARRPLVLMLAGPPGHGKTEMARRLGFLMNMDLEVVDCSVDRHEHDLFGNRAQAHPKDQGSPLNSFLSLNHGQASIVLLKKAEKLAKDAFQALLPILDSGEYVDRRDSSRIDCSKTIWIMSTNALDSEVTDFFAENAERLEEYEDMAVQSSTLANLSRRLKEAFSSKVEPLIVGRISAFLPFFPFTSGEQAAVVHEYLLDLSSEVRSPVRLSDDDDERLIGNVRLRIPNDVALCKYLATNYYHADSGARSLIAAVDQVRGLLVESYLQSEGEITESAGPTDFVIDVDENGLTVHPL